MSFYGWKIKKWKFEPTNMKAVRQEMQNWCKKHRNKYRIREIYVNNAYAVEYRLLLIP